MIRSQDVVRIARPMEEVFGFVAELTNDTKWQDFVASTERTSATGGLGATYVRSYKNPFGKPMPGQVVVTAYEAPVRIAFDITTASGTGSIEARFEPDGDGTRLTRIVELHHKGIWRLLAPLMAPMMRAGDRKALARLRQVLERTP